MSVILTSFDNCCLPLLIARSVTAASTESSQDVDGLDIRPCTNTWCVKKLVAWCWVPWHLCCGLPFWLFLWCATCQVCMLTCRWLMSGAKNAQHPQPTLWKDTSNLQAPRCNLFDAIKTTWCTVAVVPNIWHALRFQISPLDHCIQRL